MVRTRKIGYMALVRNPRNIIEDAPEVVYEACVMLLQPELVRKSRLLPFRFVTARNELEKLAQERTPGAVEKAIRSVGGPRRRADTAA